MNFEANSFDRDGAAGADAGYGCVVTGPCTRPAHSLKPHVFNRPTATASPPSPVLRRVLSALAVAAVLLAAGCRTNVYIIGTPPERVTILNGTFWRSAGGEGTGTVSNAVSGGATLKVTP